jgi:hypothetical protein
MEFISRLVFFLHLFHVPLLMLSPLLFLLLLLTLQIPPLARDTPALLPECLSVDVWAKRDYIRPPYFQFGLELFDVRLGAHLVRFADPSHKTVDVEG